MNSNTRFNSDKWTDSLRQRMDNYSEQLPAGLWEEIETELSKIDMKIDPESFSDRKTLQVSVGTSDSKVIHMWRKWQSVAAAAVVMLAVSTVSVWYWLHESESVEEVITANKIITDSRIPAGSSETEVAEVSVLNDDFTYGSVPGNRDFSRGNETGQEKLSGDGSGIGPQGLDFSESDSGLKQEHYLANNTVDVFPDTVRSDNDKKPVVVKNINDESSEQSKTTEGEGQDNSGRKRLDMMKADRETVRRNAYLAMAEKNGQRRSSANVFQLGLSTGNIPYSASDNFNGLSRLASTRALPQTNDVVISEVSGGSASYSQVLFNNRDQKATTDVKHDIPVTLGASVKWNWNDDWALESGLAYTILSSELHSGGKSYMEEKQKLHYIGIPLKVHRSVWNNDIFSFYASAGGMVEKCVSGTLETVYVTGNTEKSEEKTDLNIKPLQWSVMAAVGAQVNFCRFASVYVEPGVAYYFDDNSGVMTIRKDHPLNFNLQLGLRFNLNK